MAPLYPPPTFWFHFVAQADLELSISLPQHWGHTCAPPSLAMVGPYLRIPKPSYGGITHVYHQASLWLGHFGACITYSQETPAQAPSGQDRALSKLPQYTASSWCYSFGGSSDGNMEDQLVRSC